MRRLGFCLAFPALFEVALACAAEPREPARVALREGRWFINDRATNAGRSAEGLLMNVRIVNATFEDHLRADFDAEANADRFIARIPDYAGHGSS